MSDLMSVNWTVLDLHETSVKVSIGATFTSENLGEDFKIKDISYEIWSERFVAQHKFCILKSDNEKKVL